MDINFVFLLLLYTLRAVISGLELNYEDYRTFARLCWVSNRIFKTYSLDCYMHAWSAPNNVCTKVVPASLEKN